MANPEHHIVVSWSAADDTDCACYVIAIYPFYGADAPSDFVTIDDSESGQDRLGINEDDCDKIQAAIDAFVREYNLDADSLQVSWDI